MRISDQRRGYLSLGLQSGLLKEVDPGGCVPFKSWQYSSTKSFRLKAQATAGRYAACAGHKMPLA